MSQEVASMILDQVAPETPGVEASPEAPAEVTPLKEDSQPQRQEALSPRLEVLIRREQAAITREKAAKVKEAEVQSQFQELDELRALREARKSGNHKRVFELLKYNKDEIAKSVFEEEGNPLEMELKALRDELHTYKNSQSEVEKQRMEEAKKQAEVAQAQAVTDFKSTITTYLKDNSARYELINFEDQHDVVYEVIDEHYNRTLNPDTGIGKVMSIAEAADKVEEWLEKKYDKSRNVEKVKALWGAVPPKVLEQAVKPKLPFSQKPATLTNNLSATPQAPRKTALTDAERVQKAIAYAKSLRPSL